MGPIYQTLLNILESRSFEGLEPFKQAEVWTTFAHEERLLFAKLLVLQGTHQLAEGAHQGLESFRIASKIALHAPEILYQQATILSSYRENIHCLILASQACADMLKQQPDFCKGWYLQAQIFVDIGIFENESSYFLEAHQYFEKVYHLLEKEENLDRGELYWKWGLCWASLGKHSGEPSDFYQALNKYRFADQLGCRPVKFLNDFGRAFTDLADLIANSETYFLEALKLFNRAVCQDKTDFDSWYHQACCIQNLIEHTCHYDKFLEQANRSFQEACKINPQSSRLWLRWGQLELTVGKIKYNTEKLEASLQKFAKAQELEPDHPEILNSWADAELLLGAELGRLDFIESARSKLMRSIELQPEDPDVWYSYASCFNELGNYFDEESYYREAIEKFQYGLSLARQHPLLWYGLGIAHFALGELTEDASYFEKAIRYYFRVFEHHENGFPQFWNDWGMALLKLGELTKQSTYVIMAIEKFERALKQPIQNAEGEDVDLEWIYNYGCAFDLLADLKEEPAYFEKAISILTQVVKLDSNYTQARYSLALAFAHLAEAVFDVEYYYKAAEHFQYLVEQNLEEDMIHLDFGVALTNLALLIQDVYQPESSLIAYRQAENQFMQAAALGNTQSYYQLAGLCSIMGHYDHAMHYLERSQIFGTLPGIEDLVHDEWLEGLRQFPAFRRFVNELSSQQQSMDDK